MWNVYRMKVTDKLIQRYASPTRKIIGRNWIKTDNIRLWYVDHASTYQFQCLKNQLETFVYAGNQVLYAIKKSRNHNGKTKLLAHF